VWHGRNFEAFSPCATLKAIKVKGRKTMFQKKDPLHGKRVLIMGFARQGRALARWLPRLGAIPVVSDSKSAEQLQFNRADYPTAEFILNDDQTQLPNKIDVLCVSGGVSLETPMIQQAYERRVRVTNDAQLFIERCPAPISGITGSAGKTTTTTLVGEISKAAGLQTYVGGNIGDVLLDVLPQIKRDDRVIMELSSFQLELMTRAPGVSAVLNVTPNHLDRHGTMENYLNAKANILKWQPESGVAVLNLDDEGSLWMEQHLVGRMVGFTMREMLSDGAFLIGDRLCVVGDCSPDGDPKIVAERAQIQLRGDHNIANVLAACAITGAMGIAPEAMTTAITQFRGVAHRLELVRVHKDVTYINDSIATAPERVMAALKSYHEPLVLLLGGKDKNLPWDAMLRMSIRQSRQIIAFGHAGEMIAERTQVLGGAAERVETLELAVKRAAEVAQAGDVVLLSPGGTSYDAYVDFAQRGEHFRALVNAL
jgi:UDP-N-acetylmuramoylalanine--D-glutamate ligase